MRRNGLRSRRFGRFCLCSTGWVSGSNVRTTPKLRQAKPVATHRGSGTAICASCPPRKGPKMKPRPKATPMRPKVRARCSGELISARTAEAVAAVPPLMPSMTRALNNKIKGHKLASGQGTLRVIANRPSPTTDPATQMAMTGLRP